MPGIATESFGTDKGKPAERRGRKATGLRVFPRTAGLPSMIRRDVEWTYQAPVLNEHRRLISTLDVA